MVIETYERLRSMPTEELMQLYDMIAPQTVVGTGFLRDEIARRDAEKQTAEIARMTREMRNLTRVITALTAIAALAALAALVPLMK
jgi:hypothetical protein